MQSTQWKRQAFRFLSGQTVSLFGSSLAQYALIWQITLSTSSGRMLTLSTLCGFLPQLAVSLFAGVWADRFPRKRLIILSDAATALAALLLALTLFFGREPLWLIFAVLAVRSAGAGIQTPAVQSAVGQLVPGESRMRVNGLYATAQSLTTFLSPALGGALLSVLPLGAVLLADVATAAAGMLLTAGVKLPRLAAGGAENGIKGLREGLHYLRESPFLRRLLFFQAPMMLLISPAAFLPPLLVARNFGAEVWRLTVGEMTYSAGMILGGLLIAAWGGFRDHLRTTALAGGVYGLLMIGLGASPWFLLYLACNTLIGICSPCYNTPITAAIQERVPDAMQGRAFGLFQAVTSCALPLGMAVFGPLADLVPAGAVLCGCGTAAVLLCAGAYFGGRLR